MPRINIYEQDNTGSSPVADLAVVFVPGTAEIADNKADANNCVYIPSTASDLSQYFKEPNYTYDNAKEADIDVRHMVEMLIGQNYGVIYKQVNLVANYVNVGKLTEEQFSAGTYCIYIATSHAYTLATEYDEEETYYIEEMIPDLDIDWDFLNDKNAYDIKFVTTGNIGTVPVLGENDQGYSDVQGTEEYAFKFKVANALLDPITTRKDCALLLDLDYDADKIGLKANTLAKDFKIALEYPKEGGAAEADWRLMKVRDSDNSCVSSRAYTLFTNCEMTYSDSTGDHVLRVPGSFVYLYAYATVNNVAASWLPISGVTRGIVGDRFTPDIDLSKYFLDTQIISDDAGVSFNGVVDVRSYGYTIWGDRTLIQQDAVKKVQATSYFSLRNLISDIAKTAYNSAIRYTYETNNDVTWLNFKQAIVTLLDQMVSSGVLQTYKIGRIPSTDTERNKMKALIKIYPLLPVENFDVYINLENAEVTTTADDVTA